MNLALFLSSYINLNLLVGFGFLGLWIFSIATQKWNFRLSSIFELKLHYLVFTVILLLSAIHPFLPTTEMFEPAAKIWSSSSSRNFSEVYQSSASGQLIIPSISQTAVSTDSVSIIGLSLLIFLAVAGLLFFIRDIYRFYQFKRQSYILRSISPVKILVSDRIAIPFSYWLPFQVNVIVPSSMILKPEELKISILHELQHHRHGDTKWIYILWILKAFCFLNPALYLWSRWVSEIQEFACDETLVDLKKVDSQAYARCLVEVAQSAINHKSQPVCATGLAFLVERNLLKRRIEKMFTQPSNKLGRSIRWSIALAITSSLAVTSYAARGVIQDKRISMEQAQEMVRKAQSDSGFPVEVNEIVLKQLNRYLGTPEGREFMRKSLQRMEEHRAVVESHLKKYKVPEELLALPITESGYRNLPESQNSGWPTWNAAGIWQFIASTARNYGLKVTESKDERLDVTKQTDAAMRLLVANKMRFNDWLLSLMAYNMGEGALQKGINRVGSKDPWVLVKNGVEGDKDYLAKVMAAVIIMKNPEAVD